MEEPLTEDMLAELNYDNIPNFEKIDDRFKNLSYDPENKYTVPYTWGTLGIIYNTAKVQEPITSWSAMFDPQYAERAAYQQLPGCSGHRPVVPGVLCEYH